MNPWDNDPVVRQAGSEPAPLTITPGLVPQNAAPQGANPWDADPVVQQGGDASAAVGQGLINGIPIAGPLLLGGINRGVVAPLRMLSHGESYDDALKAAQGFGEQTSEQHPYANAAGEMAGAGLSMAAVLPEAALGLGKVTTETGERVLAPLMQRAGQAAVAQGEIGAADAKIRGQSPLAGGGMGAAGGLLGPIFGAGAGAGYRAIKGALQPAAPQLQGMSSTAAKWLARGLDGATPEEIQAARGAVGPHGMMAEVTPQMLDLAKSVADNNGAGKSIVRKAFQDRADATNSRVIDARMQAFGPSVSPVAYQGVLDNARAEAARQTSGIIGNGGPVHVQHLIEALSERAGKVADGSPEQAAIAKAQNLLTKPAPPPKPEPSPWMREPVPGEPAGEPLPEGPLYDDYATTTRPTKPQGIRPQTLHDFIRSVGGIQDARGDVASMGLNKLIAKPGQGLGADAMRQAAAQAGYLGADVDHAMRSTDVNDLLNAIGNDKPVHSVFDDDAVHAWSEYDAARQQYDMRPDPSRSAKPPKPPMSAYGSDVGEPWGPASAVEPGPSRVPITDPVTAYSARKTIDHYTQFGLDGQKLDSASRDANGALQSVRRGLSDALGEAVPGYQENMDMIHALIKRREAVDLGGEATALGNKIRPDDHATRWADVPPENRRAEQVGMLGNLDAAIGRGRNDFQAALNHFQGNPGDPAVGWNAQKYETAFGKQPVADFDKALQHEMMMRRNAQHVVGGSPTSENQSIRELTKPDVKTGFLGYLANMRPLDQPATILPPFLHPQNLGERFYAGRHAAAREEIAPILTSQGSKIDAMVKALMDAKAKKAAIEAPNMDALVRALTAVRAGGQQQMLGN